MTTKSETTYLCACGAVHEEWETSQERAWDDVMASCTDLQLAVCSEVRLVDHRCTQKEIILFTSPTPTSTKSLSFTFVQKLLAK